MALILLDGCEDFSSIFTGNSMVINNTGRYNKCFRATGGNAVSYTLRPDQEADTLTVGFAYRFGAGISGGGTIFMMKSDAGATDHFQLDHNGSGSLSLLRPFTTVANSAAGIINIVDRWYYIEVQHKMADAGGTIVVRVDGAQVASFTGDTKNAGTKTVFDQVMWRHNFGGSAYADFDDIYIRSAATTPDSFLGPIAVEHLYPNGNGSINVMQGSDGDAINNYLLVDEVGTPVTSDYVYGSTVGQIDQYTLTDLVHTSGTIVGVDHSAYMLRSDSATPRSIRVVNRRAADTKSAAIPLTTNWRSYDYCLTVDPETGALFTIADVNSLQTGVELA